MVAGMLMPLEDLRSIYEVLFRDGVMVAKKDRRPQCMHPDVQGVSNLKVIRAMGSLKSSGFVRETFAWRHSYWYLTNEGIAHVRDFLHLPPEIIPSTLQRVRSTVSTLHPAHRAAHVQRIKGPTSFVPKSRTKEEHQEDVLDRQGYRSKRTLSKEPETQPEKMAMSFRGSYSPKFSEKETAHQKQRFGHSPDSFREEERGTAKNLNKYSSTSYSNMASRAVHSASKEVKIVTPIRKQQEESEASQPDVPEEEISAAKPNKSIKAAQSFIAPAEEGVTSLTETMKMDIPVPLVEAVKEDLFIAQAEPVGEMLDVGSVQKCMDIASDQVSTDSVALVKEGAGQQMQETEEFIKAQEQVVVLMEPKKKNVEQFDPDVSADTDAPLTAPSALPVDNDQSTVNQVVQEWQILEPKEQKETLKVLEEPLCEEVVMMTAVVEPQPAISDITWSCTYLHQAGDLDKEVTEVLPEIQVAEDVEELSSQMTHQDANIEDVTSVEETIDAEPAVVNEKVLQMPVVDDWLIVSHSHDEPKGGEQANDEFDLHQPQESAEFDEQSKQLEVMMVQEEAIRAGDVMQAMDALKISSGDACAAAQNILEEDLSEITELEPLVEESATNASAMTSVAPEESLTAVSSNLLLTQFSPETDPYVDPSEIEVQDTAVLHAAVNVKPPSEDFTVLHPGAIVIQSSEEVDEAVAEHPVQELPSED